MEKPTMKQRLESLGTFIWDSENGKILGRGGRSWAEIGVFYLIYYACLCSFFAATLAVFYETVSNDEPKLQSDSSLLDGNPGLGYRPRIDLKDMKVKAKPELGKNKEYRKNLDTFLEKYQEDLESVNCAGVKTTRKNEKEACEVDYKVLTKECSPKTEYGFSSGDPCVLIKLNKVYGWEPKLWKDESEAKFNPDWNMDYDPAVIPLRCYAKDKADKDKIGDLAYYPQQGFPIHYYPFMRQKDYRAPVVFVQFANITRDRTMEIECRAYAKNIEYDQSEMQGSTQFKIYVAKD